MTDITTGGADSPARVAVDDALRRERETAERLEALMELGAALARTQDPESVLGVLGRVGFAVTGVDSLALAIMDEEARNLRVAMVVDRRNPDVELDDRWSRLAIDDHTPQGDVVRTGRSLYLGDRASFLDRYPHLADEVQARGHEAWATLAMVAGDRLIGVLGLAWSAPRSFLERERSLLEAMATWVAQAYAQAETAAHHRSTARRLQLALLPSLPRLPDFEIAARYEPAGRDSLVGGDWFDVAEIDDERVLVTVGDVTGHGVAAAAAMSELRPMLRGLVAGGAGPGEALSYLDRDLTARHGDLLATVACLVIDRRTGDLTYALGGHPPPLLLRAVGDDGEAEWLLGRPGPILGAGLGRHHPEHAASLAVGDTLVGFTDGAFERRGGDLSASLDGLAELVGAHHADLPGLCQQVVEAQLDEHGPRDDIAVLAIRRRAA